MLDKGPLSGDVMQSLGAIFSKPFQQWGVINIYETQAGEPDLELKIIQSQASYGRQLGRIMEAMEILVGKVDKGKLSDEEKHALEDFSTMARSIGRAKKRFQSCHVVD